jgi:hypothetical protein
MSDKLKSCKCKHYWNYEHVVYSAKKGEGCAVRRWCVNCGVIQTATATRWRKTSVGVYKEFSFYPKGYPKKFQQLYESRD